VATTTLTTSEAAVLALLAMEDDERSGYDLLTMARRSVGYVWAPAKSQLYAVLPRLVRAGLARVRPGGRDRGPDRELYRITPRGEQVMREWVETVEPSERDRQFLRIFLAGLADHGSLVAQVEQFREDTQAQLDEYRRVEQTNTRTGHDYYHHLMLRLGIAQAETALAWTDEVLGELAQGS
jgi:DNA-binding PadR family transcriptional regulator